VPRTRANETLTKKIYYYALRIQRTPAGGGPFCFYPSAGGGDGGCLHCGEPVTRNNDDWNLMNPSVIVEVLSKSTMDYDRNEKFELYKALVSLREYILVDSRSVLAEQFCKNGDGKWISKKYDTLTDCFVLETVKVGLLLEEVYENVRFPRLSD
jgi:Putative restriction endonuclease